MTNFALVLFAAAALTLSSAQPVCKFSALTVPPGWHRVSMVWNYCPGWETNGISFNVREFPDNDNRRDLFSCHIVTNVVTLGADFFAHPGLWRGVTATNRLTGAETTDGIAPVSQVTF